MTTTRAPRRATRPAGPPTTNTASCCCRRLHLGKLQPTIAHFVDGDLVSVQRRHWAGRDGCRMPTEHLDPHTYSRRSRLEVDG